MTETISITCIRCPIGCDIELEVEDGEILSMEGADCIQGEEYAREEYRNPTRVLPTTVRVTGGVLPYVPVKTAEPIPKGKLEAAVEELATVEAEAPIELGDVIVENVCGTGVDIVATRDLPAEESGPIAAD
jgi:CxxC motif-containing protein